MAMKPTRKTRKVKEATPVYATAPALTHETYRTNITSKGQIVIPAALRRKYGITPKTRILIFDDGEGIVLKPVTTRELIEQLRGSMAGSGTMQEYLAEKAREIGREDADLRRPR